MLCRARDRKVRLHYIPPRQPIYNAFIERFNGRFRDECLNENEVFDLAEARQISRHGAWITTPFDRTKP